MTLTVVDGPRELKPTQVAFDRVCFAKPPHLTSAEVEIILTNGDAVQRHTAVVLPPAQPPPRIRSGKLLIPEPDEPGASG